MANQTSDAGEDLIINPEELQRILDRARAEDIPVLVTALRNTYNVLEAHRVVIELYDTLIDKIGEEHNARIELLRALNDRDYAVWEAIRFMKDYREQEQRRESTPNIAK